MTYSSNGKLLLTGEYLVLDGAKALALPTKYQQHLKVTPQDHLIISWKSYDEHNKLWFQANLSIDGLEVLEDGMSHPFYDEDVAVRLTEILKEAQHLNPHFLSKDSGGFKIETHQDFNRFWGLGTSSTLINNIAQWAEINPYELLEKTFGGSGYDIACAQHDTPLIYERSSSHCPKITPMVFHPDFKEHLYFVYLNTKQNSRSGIANYRKKQTIQENDIAAINTITLALFKSSSLGSFNLLLDKHEALISKIIEQPTVKQALFNDFNGHLKSLGAWGGDFILATCTSNPTQYFKEKGYNVIIPYEDMIKTTS